MSVLPRIGGDTICDGKRDPNGYSRNASTGGTAWAIRGSGLHNEDGAISTTKNAGMPDHNSVGEIVEVGSESRPFRIAVGRSCRSLSLVQQVASSIVRPADSWTVLCHRAQVRRSHFVDHAATSWIIAVARDGRCCLTNWTHK